MTFDNKFYDFSGSQGCSYLLTSDFLHNRFSVVANYAEELKRTSLTVVTDNKRVDIDTKSADDGETIKVRRLNFFVSVSSDKFQQYARSLGLGLISK